MACPACARQLVEGCGCRAPTFATTSAASSTIAAAAAATAAPPYAGIDQRLAPHRAAPCIPDALYAAPYVMAPPHSADMTLEVTDVPTGLDRTSSITSLDGTSVVCSVLSREEPLLRKESRTTEEEASAGQRMTVLYEEDAATCLDRLEDATLAGLSRPVKGLSSMYFYDDKGSRTLDE